MTRRTGSISQEAHGRTLMSGEPLVFHCNHYNYWLQKTLLLPEGLGRVTPDRFAAVARDTLGPIQPGDWQDPRA